uniref:Uncharacterized protein n=1 Tax=Romanomermis culicivorax TaxID=13658 RepID=A0A915HPS2_ROMCU
MNSSDFKFVLCLCETRFEAKVLLLLCVDEKQPSASRSFLYYCHYHPLSFVFVVASLRTVSRCNRLESNSLMSSLFNNFNIMETYFLISRRAALPKLRLLHRSFQDGV